ncbi:unnamed protein product [Gemmataceae bacterium]|nr:unnamed protein product [Gemmataceae bacterium]VTT99256.1 unnamed protein product [Gemmataceae bacterium]
MALRHFATLALSVACFGPVPAGRVHAEDYAYKPADPQPSGWPLTEAERKYVLRAEHERRPGAEAMKHLPAM